MKKLITTMLSLMIIAMAILSCTNPKLGEDRLNLEKFDLNFNVGKFYANEIDKEKKYEEQKDVLLEKIHKKDYTEKEFEELDEKLSELNNFKWIKIDTVYNQIYNSATYTYENDLKNIIGLQYNMMSWGSEDSLAYYGKMHFKKVDMAKSPKGDFMALVALSESEGADDFKQLLNHIEQNHGKAAVKEYEFFGSYFVYFWELEDRLLAISSKYDDKENTLKLGIEISEDSVKIDTTKQPTINTKLFILNNQYKQDTIIRRFHSGDWLYFMQILDKE